MSGVHRSNPSPGTMIRYQWEDYQRRMNFQFRHLPDVAERQARGILGDSVRQLFDPLLRGIRGYEGEIQSRIPGNQYPRGNVYGGGYQANQAGAVYRGESAWQAADRLAHQMYPSQHVEAADGYRPPDRRYGAYNHSNGQGGVAANVLRENSQSIIVSGSNDAQVQTFPVREPAKIEVHPLEPIGQQTSAPSLSQHQQFVENSQSITVGAASKHPALDALAANEMQGRFSNTDQGIYARAAAQLDKFGL